MKIFYKIIGCYERKIRGLAGYCIFRLAALLLADRAHPSRHPPDRSLSEQLHCPVRKTFRRPRGTSGAINCSITKVQGERVARSRDCMYQNGYMETHKVKGMGLRRSLLAPNHRSGHLPPHLSRYHELSTYLVE